MTTVPGQHLYYDLFLTCYVNQLDNGEHLMSKFYIVDREIFQSCNDRWLTKSKFD